MATNSWVTWSELLHRQVALLLRQIAVQTVGVITVGYQFVGYLLRVLLGAAEHDAVYVRAIVHHPLQRQILVVCLDHVVYVAHVLGALVAVAGHELHRLVHEPSRYVGYLLGHRGREHQHLALLRHMGQNLVDVVHKTHVQHLVCLVQHHRMYVLQLHHAALDQVDQTSRSGHYHLHTVAQRANLALDAAAAIHGQDLQPVYVFGEVGQVAGYLQTEFARGCYYQCLRRIVAGIYALQQRQSEGRRLARTGLGQAHGIAVLVQQMGYYHLLDGHGAFEAKFLYGLEQTRLHAKRRERLDLVVALGYYLLHVFGQYAYYIRKIVYRIFRCHGIFVYGLDLAAGLIFVIFLHIVISILEVV